MRMLSPKNIDMQYAIASQRSEMKYICRSGSPDKKETIDIGNYLTLKALKYSLIVNIDLKELES